MTILSPIAITDLPKIFTKILSQIENNPLTVKIIQNIAATTIYLPQNMENTQNYGHYQSKEWHDACQLAGLCGLELCDETPQSSFSWDGKRLRSQTSASVLIHEIAHYLIAPPHRRSLIDFGLGAGPETGYSHIADNCCLVDDDTKMKEEVLTSMLGILWEAELKQAAIIAFLEQNWLEGYLRPSFSDFLINCIKKLNKRGLIDEQGHPVLVTKFLTLATASL